MAKSLKIAGIILGVAVVAGAGAFAIGVGGTPLNAPPEKTFPVVDKDGKQVGVYRLPDDTTIPSLPNAELVLYGKRLLNETARLLPDHVGDKLNCNSCHLGEGKVDNGAPYINTVNDFPQFNPRAGRVVTLKERINGCFMRSMNGKPLAPDSREMSAMIAYMDWLRNGVPKGQRVQVVGAGPIDMKLVPDPVRGEKLYAQHCATCHGGNGEGMKGADGNFIFPPLWGDESFNIGAGMARLYKAAAFIKFNMPVSVNLDHPVGQGGVLNDQDAVDVAEFFTHQPRPDFAGKVNDWANGKKPKDARY